MSRLVLLGLVLLGAVFGAGGVWLAERVAPGELGTVDRARIERVIRDYVLANPELIPQAMQHLQQRDSARLVAAHRGDIATPVGSAWKGNAEGDVVVTEFFDYNCGYCRAILPTLDQLVKGDRNVRVVYKELPVLGEESRTAARWSLVAAERGRFDRFHDAVYAAGPVSQATLERAARIAGLDPAAIARAAAAPAIGEAIDANLALAARLGMNGTPSWVIGDSILAGAQPLDQLQDAVAAARAR